MRRWWLAIVLLLSLGLNVGILASVAVRRLGPGGPGAKPPGANQQTDPLPRLPQLANRLGLEGEERRKFLDIQWNLYQETSHLRLQLGETHRNLRHELIQPQPDRARVDALLEESSRTYLALEKSLVTNILATRDLLGPEKEKQYLRLIGQLRIPNPGGFGPNAGLGGQKQRPGQRLRQRLRQQRLQEEAPQQP
ncbi:MAG TPA: periplasmic heavy metal sensor [Thermoanaerobaculia bacterium]|nr:periplasmic heavy metal sensor [Thermoanaerobaculia bacterium]